MDLVVIETMNQGSCQKLLPEVSKSIKHSKVLEQSKEANP